MINTFTHSRSSLEKHTRFQTKMGTKTLPFEGVEGGGGIVKGKSMLHEPWAFCPSAKQVEYGQLTDSVCQPCVG